MDIFRSTALKTFRVLMKFCMLNHIKMQITKLLLPASRNLFLAVIISYPSWSMADGNVMAKTLEVELLVRSGVSDSGEALVSGDVVLGGSEVRLHVIPRSPGRISVSFLGAGRPPVVLVRDQLVAAEASLSLPGTDDWYKLDSAQGIGRFKVTLIKDTEAAETSFDFLQLANFSQQVDNIFSAEDGSEGLIAANAEALLAVREDEAFENAAAAIPILLKMLNSKGVTLRGAAGAKIYRNFANSVSLIATKTGTGSGVFVGDKGYIITNLHVVSGFRRVAVVLKPKPGQNFKKKDVIVGTVTKIDEISDLALIKISKLPNRVTPIVLGRLADVEVGADAHAIGHPSGESWTYTQGVISQIRGGYRWKTGLKLAHKATVIQTQTAINPGNSGGPLLDNEGRLIGINSFVRKQTEGLNYAVAISDVKAFLKRKKSRVHTVRLNKQGMKAAKKCQPKIRNIDKNKNGVYERKLVDTDCDGKFDTLILDKNEDGNPETILKDTNGDGKLNLKIVKSQPGGRFDVWLLDKDGDRKPDLVGRDTDGDGKPDKFRQIS
jgi:S1-C subfamily serine protease